MCDCENVGFGTFGQPNQNRTAVETCMGRIQEIDNCILAELQYLWKYHIITFASCCGHNKVNGSIIVDESEINKMKLMGYVQADIWPGKRKFHEEESTWFYTKSVAITNKYPNQW